MPANDSKRGEDRLRSDDSTVWVEAMLRESPPVGLLTACEAASRDGLMLLKLRQADRRWPSAFWQPAPAYLRALAATARVPLDAAARWARLPCDLRLSPEFGAGWGRLTRALDWDEAVALLRLRLAFAEEAGELLLPLAGRRPIGPGASRQAVDLPAALAALAASAAGWDPALRDRLRKCEADFRQTCGVV